jgi:hypothetical protein
MAQGEDLAQAAKRLEAALERIAFGADRLRRAPGESGASPELDEIAQCLDTLIVQLRRTLASNNGPD